jgi:hypothetical protein
MSPLCSEKNFKTLKKIVWLSLSSLTLTDIVVSQILGCKSGDLTGHDL